MSEEVDYTCSPELKRRIPEILSGAGIETKPLSAQAWSEGQRFELLCTRDGNRIHISGYEDGDDWTYTLDFANPFRFLFYKGDRELRKEIEAALMQHGARCNGVPLNAPPDTP